MEPAPPIPARNVVICVVLLAALYAAWIALVPNEPISDQKIYYDQAVRVAEGHGYVDDSGEPTAYWAPGYSFYLAGAFRILGESYRSAFVANLATAGALALGVYALGKKLYGDRTAATAALLTAAYPSIVFYTTVIASEILFSALIVWSFYLVARSETERRWLPWAAAAGVALGAASFTRPQAMILGLALLAWPGPWRNRAVRALVVSGFLFLTLVPWGLRNARELGGFVWVSRNAGHNLWIGNHPEATGGYEDFDRITRGFHLASEGLVARDAHLQRLAQEYIRSHPLEYLVLCAKRIGITFRSESGGVAWNLVGLTHRFGPSSLVYFKTITNTVYLGLCAFVVYALLRRRAARDGVPADTFLFAVLLLLALPSVLILGASRFHLPMVPFAILFAASRWRAHTLSRALAPSPSC